MPKTLTTVFPHIIMVKVNTMSTFLKCNLNKITGIHLTKILQLQNYVLIPIPRREITLNHYITNQSIIRCRHKLRGGAHILGTAFKDKYGKNNNKLLNKIHQKAYALNKKFPGIRLSSRNNKSIWPIIYYKNESNPRKRVKNS